MTWKEDSLGNLTTKIGSGATPRGGESVYKDSGISLIRSQNVYDFRFELDGLAFIDDEQANALANVEVQPNDVLLNITGDSIGRCCIVPIGLLPARVNQHVAIVRASESLDSRFLLYCLNNPITKDRLLQRIHGATRKALTKGLIEEFKISFPPLPIQSRIADILGALDDKIECNRRINQTLEAMADAYFKHWFLDSDNGWESKPFDEVATFLNGLALQKYPPKDGESLPVIKIAELHRGVSESGDRASAEIPSQYIVEDGDILFSWSGSLEVCVWCGGRGALNQHLFKVTSAEYPKWFYYQWVRHHLPEFRAIAAGKATTMGHIQRQHLHQALVVVPPIESMQMMNNKMQPLLDQIITNNLESCTLARTRDYLLPRLLSGEVEVKVVEEQLEKSQ